MSVQTTEGRGGRLSEAVRRCLCGQLNEKNVPNRARFYDRDGNGMWLREAGVGMHWALKFTVRQACSIWQAAR